MIGKVRQSLDEEWPKRLAMPRPARKANCCAVQPREGSDTMEEPPDYWPVEERGKSQSDKEKRANGLTDDSL
ncbi:uncharacterized protein A4U43_C01F25260 [Asparagus officinalis]|uniref:Uncharacterized protein n=1 Tax=Asparagus officinalis TaxID=4686 RepID=A0A5P1FS99_ASPOF|nr:uncharacterized protein A4U43_C01F25260 [Asparagus officinalis]